MTRPVQRTVTPKEPLMNHAPPLERRAGDLRALDIAPYHQYGHNI